ncbi:MAG: CHAD domain-containing protein [Planctomycetaceae bacterium]|nr:CHAD domain-containing protein [Planctomycetaceae bacterium]
MAYRFKLSESLCDGVRRVASELLEKSMHVLTSTSVEQPVAVHEFRKNCKKLRGLLRLIRPKLGAIYELENSWYRDIARELSRARDAQVLVETVDKLRGGSRSPRTTAACDHLRQKLEHRRREVVQDRAALDKLLPRLAELVSSARDRMQAWPLEESGFGLIGPGLKQIYRKGRKAYQQSLNDLTDERLHDWRKRTKDHWYHTRLLRSAWPTVMRARAMELNKLGELLGEDHDLAVLQWTLQEETDLCRSEKDRERIIRKVTSRKQRLRRRAFRLGELMFAESPTALVTRLEAYWVAGVRFPT